MVDKTKNDKESSDSDIIDKDIEFNEYIKMKEQESQELQKNINNKK